MNSIKSRLLLPAALAAALMILGACSMEPAEPAANPLAGTSWDLESYGSIGGGTPAVTGSVATLEFGSVNEVAGSGGCNSFGGMVEVQGTSIAFSDITSTLMACEDAAVMDQEAALLTGLNTAERYAVSAGELVIFYGDDQALYFSDGPPDPQ
jgi:putative lipoprotein